MKFNDGLFLVCNLFLLIGLGILSWQYNLFLNRYQSITGESISAKIDYKIDRLMVYNEVIVLYKFIVVDRGYFGKFIEKFDDVEKAQEYVMVFNKTQEIEIFYNRDDPEENWAKNPYYGAKNGDGGLFMIFIALLTMFNILCLNSSYIIITVICNFIGTPNPIKENN